MTTSNIQIDMFEVQLGASILLQFATGENWVSVLADAGIKASGYPIGHVLNKIKSPNTLKAGSGGIQRIDLMIGTHYDADHLDGLVPIINDPDIEIGEAWLPPVANDSEIHAMEDSVQDQHLLAHQFARDDGEITLRNYLQAKSAICEEIGALEHAADEYRGRELRPRNRRDADERNNMFRNNNIEEALAYFESQLRDANITLGIVDYGHADDDVLIPYTLYADELDGRRGFERVFSQFFEQYDPYFHRRFSLLNNSTRRGDFFLERWRDDRDVDETDARNLAFIRRAAAKDAINATSLEKVVTALKLRGVPIVCRVIQDGEPRRFAWDSKMRRFIPGEQLQTTGPEITLLGPSEGLVKKHWNRLPIGNYMEFIAFSAIPIKSITPSNQLSYVVKFKFDGQGILIAGDAGCVDFKTKRGSYYKKLTNALLPLHVVQVAHHSGNNAHFYRFLLKAGYAAQKTKSLLLLSHATQDQHRPSKEFGMFIEKVRKDEDTARLLFTSEPNPQKVRDYLPIIHPVVGNPAAVGDVRIEYDAQGWQVKSHAVKVHFKSSSDGSTILKDHSLEEIAEKLERIEVSKSNNDKKEESDEEIFKVWPDSL